MRPTSSSSAEPPAARLLAPGTIVDGFRVEGVLGHGLHGVVYEATQIELSRRVALRLLPGVPEGSALRWPPAWPDHVHVVPLYAAGDSEHGRFAAMGLVRGGPLRELLAAGQLGHGEALLLLTDLAQALDAAHAAGIVHGAVTAGNVLVDQARGALLSDFGLVGPEATARSDLEQFGALICECLSAGKRPLLDHPASASAVVQAAAQRSRGSHLRRPRSMPRATVTLVIAAAIGVGVIGAALSDHGAVLVPGVPRGLRPLGSALLSGSVRSVDCNGQRPGGSSPACTVMQMQLPGRIVIATRTGTIREWVVRGARGDLALQIIRPLGHNRYTVDATSGYVHVRDTGVHVIPADLTILAHDRVGVEVSPGAALGVSDASREATAARFFGPLRNTVGSLDRGTPDHPPGTGFDHELLVRVDYVPGAVAPTPRPHRGFRR